ncbi:MAG: hypothetical protein JWN30_964, partial [Bacilli bacterium]|nr:hypothetical protein [Bacilli bacterium]
ARRHHYASKWDLERHPTGVRRQRDQIDHNYFVDIPAYGINGLEIIQVMGIGSDGEPGIAGGEHVVIEENLFERADGECEEIISLKSNHDIVRNNTFKDSIGGLVIRSGHNTVVEGNSFIGGNVGGTKGIRITGEDNVVSGNYLSGLQGFAISIMSGEYIDMALTDQWQPVLREGTPLGRVPMYNASMHNTITGNFMVHNEGIDLDIGIGYKSSWPSKQRILLPEDNELSDNVVVKNHGTVIKIVEQDPAVMDIVFSANRFDNNQVFTQTKEASLPAGIVYLEQEPELKLPSACPLMAEHAGPEWVKQMRQEGEPLFQPRDQFAAVEAVPWEANGNVWVFCAGSSDVFVQNMRTKLDVQKRDVCPLDQSGTLLLPVRATAEKLGLKVTTGTSEVEIRVVQDQTEVTISPEGCRVVQSAHAETFSCQPQTVHGSLYLPAAEFAALFGKSLLQDERGLLILTDDAADTASFTDKMVINETFDLFKAVASSFEKYMTIPPQGRTHGKIPANTLNDDAGLLWAAFGDGQWIRYDLGSNYAVSGVGIAFGQEESAKYSFDVEVSANGLDWTPAASCESSAHATETERFAWEPVTGRYVRIVGHQNSVSNAIRMSRVQVYSAHGESIL